MNELKMFENLEFGNVRGIEINGEPWLVGKDVVESLGYEKKYVDVIKQHIDKEDYIKVTKETGLHNGETQNDLPLNGEAQNIEFNHKQLGRQGGYLINESGFYNLVFGSELPEAKEFKRWVTKEVLPMIRKTGGYVSNEDMFIETYMSEIDGTAKAIVKNMMISKKEEQRKHILEIKNLNQTITVKDKSINDKILVIDNLTGDIDSIIVRKIATNYVKDILGYNADRNDFSRFYKNLYSMLGTVLKMDLNNRRKIHVKNMKETIEINKKYNKKNGLKGKNRIHPCTLKDCGISDDNITMIAFVCDELKEGRTLLKTMAKLFDVGLENILEKYNYEVNN